MESTQPSGSAPVRSGICRGMRVLDVAVGTGLVARAALQVTGHRADVVGLDVCKHVGEIVSGALNKQKPDTSRLDALIAAKKLGRKSGEGFYVWRDGKAVKSSGTPAEPPADLEDRLILALANECAAVLREKIVADADLVDAGVIFGYDAGLVRAELDEPSLGG